MNIFVIYLFPLVGGGGGLGKRMLNPEALKKCHEDIFGYFGAWRGEGRGGGLQCSVWAHLGSHLPSLLIIIQCQRYKQSDKNLLKKKLNIFFRGHVGPVT